MAGPSLTGSAKQTADLHCPNCGARILRPELSLCAYCASPLQLGGAATAGKSATQERLAKMAEHPQYEVSLAWTPPEMLEHRQAATRVRRAVVVAVIFLSVGLLDLVRSGESGGASVLRPGVLLTLVALVVVAVLIARARVVQAHLTAMPVRKRPAIVHERRSETIEERFGSRTTYFFRMEFQDGSEGEFRFHGRGPGFDPMAAGATGLAYTRGADLLAFKAIRV